MQKKKFNHSKTFSEVPINIISRDQYMPYSLANPTLSKLHKNATSTGLPKPNGNSICKCCGKNLNERDFNLCENLDSFLIYGSTYTLAFIFIKFMMICLLASFLLNSGITFFRHRIIWSCMVFSCKEEEFVLSYKENFYYLRIPAFLTVIFFIFAKAIFVFILHDYHKKLRDKSFSIDSYTILVEDLEKEWTVNEIKLKMDEVSDVDFEIKKVNLIYDIKDYVEKTKKFIKLETKLIRMSMHGIKTKEYFKLKEKYKNLKTEILSDQNQYNTNKNNKFTKKAFITFNSEKNVKSIIKQNTFEIFRYKFKKSGLLFKKAPHPADIIWQNFGLTNFQKILRRFTIIILALFLIAITLTIIYFINIYQKILNKDHSKKVLFLSLLISIVISLINLALRELLIYSSFFERRTTYTSFNSSIVWKISSCYFINSAILPLLLFFKDKIFFFNVDGLAFIVLIFMVLSLFTNFLANLFDFGFWWRKFKVYRFEKKIERKEIVFQCELNKCYEKKEFDVAEMYYLTFKASSIALFFQTIIPIGTLLAILELFFNYWIFKFLFVKKSKKPKYLGFQFTVHSLRYFEVMIFFMGLGYFVFDILILNEVTKTSVGLIFISAFEFLILSTENILLLIWKDEGKIKKPHYDVVRKFFCSEYDRLNPITQRGAYLEWLDYLKILPEKDKLLKNKEFFKNKDSASSVYNLVKSKGEDNLDDNYICSNSPFLEKSKINTELTDFTNIYKLEKYNENFLMKYEGELLKDIIQHDKPFFKNKTKIREYEPIIDQEIGKEYKSEYYKNTKRFIDQLKRSDIHYGKKFQNKRNFNNDTLKEFRD